MSIYTLLNNRHKKAIIVDDLGLKNKDLVGKIGSKGYVSSLLNKKKPLTLVLAKFFHQKLNILAAVLLS
jgi:HTH-type transcriptional regulator/antitoxin HigA